MGTVLQGHSSSQPQASTWGMMRGTAATHTNPTPNLHPNLNHTEVGGGGREATGQVRLQSHPSMSSQLPARSQRLEPALPCSSGHCVHQATGHPRPGRIRPHSKPSCTLGSMEGMAPPPSPTLNSSGTRGDPLLPAPLSHPWDRAVLGAKGPCPPQDYEICLGGGGSSSGVPKPARCPGRLPAPARPAPATARNTQNTPVYCSLGGPGVPSQNGGRFPQGHPHTQHHCGSPGPKLSWAAFYQLPSPSKPGFGESSIAPRLLPPGMSPGRMGGTKPPGEVRGVRGGRGSTGGQ